MDGLIAADNNTVQEINAKFGGLDGVIGIKKINAGNNSDLTVVTWHAYLAIATYTGALGMWLILVKNSSIVVTPIIANSDITFTFVDATTINIATSVRANVTFIHVGNS